MIDPIRILYIAYPLLTVSDETAGGAEQVLWTLERQMASRGVATTVAASSGTRVTGELFSTGEPCRAPDDFERRNQEHQDRVIQFIQRRRCDGRPFHLVHDMSGSFWPRASDVDDPVLATLHLPRNFYADQLFANVPRNVFFNCVSQSQAHSFVDLPRVVGIVANGIALDLLRLGDDQQARRGLLWVGRICEEKAPHLALEIAHCAGMPITLAGQLYPFSYHRQYFDREIAPRLRAPNVSHIDSPSGPQKRRLLRKARAVLITSQVDETSSLVAMEAAASGTPVIAFARGALSEIVRDGSTGFVVDDSESAVHALKHIDEIDSNACADHARQNFSDTTMADSYTSLYDRLLTPSGTQPRDDKPSIVAV